MFVSEQLLSQYIFVIFNQWTDFFNITIFYKNRKEKRTATTCINDESKMRAVTKVDFRVGHWQTTDWLTEYFVYPADSTTLVEQP